ncbi:MAG: Gfo/Idh/MocA family oxidoreductase [Clostridia bacterium]|nr:Gfo/Idh/MocA family oxidoreductase [Clostridia bacterium]
MFKVCIIGSGMIAKSAHIPAYKTYSDYFSIVGIFDVNKQAAEEVALEFGIENVYTDAETMLKEQKPDLVSVCAPNMFHKAYTLLALNYGANVLCEKPLAFTYADAKEMFDLANEKGKTLMACQSLRFLPERLAVYEQVKNGNVGEVYYAELSRIRRRGIPTWGKFHLKEFSGGGALVDIGVHGIDSAIWLMGNPKPVSATASMNKVHANELGSAKSSGALKDNVTANTFNPDLMDVESFSSGTVKFENGAVLSFKVAWAANLKEENNIILAGQNCGIDMENANIYLGTDETKDLTVVPNGFNDEAFYGHFCLVKNMADVLKGADEPFVKPEETLNVTAILEAAYKSAEKGTEVKIDV